MISTGEKGGALQSSREVGSRFAAQHIVLISGPVSTAEEIRFAKFAAFMGVSVRNINSESVANPASLFEHLQNREDDQACVAINADTLCRMQMSLDADNLLQVTQKCKNRLLLFGFDGSPRHSDVVRWVTRGMVRGVTRSEAKVTAYHFPSGGREYSRQLAGLEFTKREGVLAPHFLLPPTGRDTKVLLRANGQPVFVCTLNGACEVFLLAEAQVPDIDEKLSRADGVEERYHQILPLLMLLRHCCGGGCWHAPETNARWIIDDPLLAPKYGFLDYKALFTSMRQEQYGTSIAFIPWNYRRTSARTVADLFRPEENFSICVHGCDHTNREFASMDGQVLDTKARLALERMQQHEKRTKLAFDRVMVFPQGRFATRAMSALRASSYLATVNSTCFPIDDDSNRLTVADCLRPAVTRYAGSPIFPRRYPKDFIHSAVDMLLGRPVLLVEHHGYFRDGYDTLQDFVRGLYKLEPALSWPTLSTLLRRSCLTRTISNYFTAVQFYTSSFLFTNKEQTRQKLLLQKHDPEAAIVQAVLINGQRVPFAIREDFLETEVEVDAGGIVNVEIIDLPKACSKSRCPRITYELGVVARRILSESRDKVLAKHPVFLSAATRIARSLKTTGDS